MQTGQACTFEDDTGRSFSAKITRVVENPDGPKTETKVNVIFTQNSLERTAELVPASRISNIHDLEELQEKAEEISEELEDRDE